MLISSCPGKLVPTFLVLQCTRALFLCQCSDRPLLSRLEQIVLEKPLLHCIPFAFHSLRHRHLRILHLLRTGDIPLHHERQEPDEFQDAVHAEADESTHVSRGRLACRDKKVLPPFISPAVHALHGICAVMPRRTLPFPWSEPYRGPCTAP